MTNAYPINLGSKFFCRFLRSKNAETFKKKSQKKKKKQRYFQKLVVVWAT